MRHTGQDGPDGTGQDGPDGTGQDGPDGTDRTGQARPRLDETKRERTGWDKYRLAGDKNRDRKY